MSEIVRLRVGGVEYSGWTEVSVTRSLESVSGRFTVTLTEKWTDTMEPWPILPGSECELTLSGDTVIKGHVDVVAPAFSAATHTIQVTGRDVTGDLVDCSCDLSPDQFSQVTLAQVVARITSPFGIAVIDMAKAAQVFEKFKIQQGETAFDAIDRACRQRGVLPISAPGQGLVLRSTEDLVRAPGSPLIQGENILSARATLAINDRFSDYVVKGQRGTSSLATPSDVSFKATAKDENVSRYRPKVVVQMGASTQATAQTRAEWEATIRAARGAEATIEVQGWRRDDGQIWAPGVVVPVRSDWLRLNGEYLVKSVALSMTPDKGTTATIGITSADAFKPEPVIEKKTSSTKTGTTSSESKVIEYVDIFGVTE